LDRWAAAASADPHHAETTLHRLVIDKLPSVIRNAAFIACLGALATLAWLPATVIKRTTLGGQAEHFIAYLGTAFVVRLAFRANPRPIAQCILLIGYAAILEAGQLFSPGRHASLADFAFSSAGVAMAGLLLWIARTRFLGRCYGLRPGQARGLRRISNARPLLPSSST
jgi:VanZ family protein